MYSAEFIVPSSILVVIGLLLLQAYTLGEYPWYTYQCVDFREMPDVSDTKQLRWIIKQYEDQGLKCSLGRAATILNDWRSSVGYQKLEKIRKENEEVQKALEKLTKETNKKSYGYF